MEKARLFTDTSPWYGSVRLSGADGLASILLVDLKRSGIEAKANSNTVIKVKKTTLSFIFPSVFKTFIG
jgi:hypothetical protein